MPLLSNVDKSALADPSNNLDKLQMIDCSTPICPNDESTITEPTKDGTSLTFIFDNAELPKVIDKLDEKVNPGTFTFAKT